MILDNILSTSIVQTLCLARGGKSALSSMQCSPLFHFPSCNLAPGIWRVVIRLGRG